MPESKSGALPLGYSPIYNGVEDGTRTHGLFVPNEARYQAALRPDGANEGIRTPDLLITNQLLYRLSHVGIAGEPARLIIIAQLSFYVY